MFKKLALASLMVFVFSQPLAQVSVSTDGGTTGGAITSSPISNSVSSVGSLSTGASTSQGGAGGLGGTSSATTGASTSQGGSVGSLSTGASTSAGGVSNATSGGASSSGNTSGNTTITSNYTAPKIPVATAVAPSNFPTAPCMGSSSIGGSAVLFGFSAGSSWEATECMTFEAARSFDQAGMHDDALAIKCTSKYSAAAPSCIKLKQQELQAQQQALVQQSAYDLTKPANINLIKGIYSEAIDPVTGFITIIDTRDSRSRIGVIW
ncbi:hypothetical protein G6666_06705 [Polynucleobacter paneuropaeus]|uniref:hypothetical protein n=1 Tax=Polynucleobacter paneuropaeus TaxID=2527775 RepID=UPI001BFDDBE5|nr:hypothetical protein [Polynucleobacter paneuropaeus]MBT8527386.1 hypothetical protein [Polynucleobacter paneuropaeus]MBT8534048.1 hypothetical protein [Polynucleobacter paneuropaeus]QWD53461.1 hypothetical protein C2752_04820 [Polynucleobacter paneuropaeus]QWD58383.1 hypothetical protein C2742_04870 [Polynucleobacter paneuropaeus]